MTHHWTLMLAAALMAMGMGTFLAEKSAGEDKVKAERLYELRTYYCYPGRLEALNQRFRDHTVKLFEKHGMKNEMYWTPTDPKLKDHVLIYIVSHDSQEAADKSWKAFQTDPEWMKVRDASEKDGKIVEKVDRVYMTLTDYSPGKK